MSEKEEIETVEDLEDIIRRVKLRRRQMDRHQRPASYALLGTVVELLSVVVLVLNGRYREPRHPTERETRD